jgi:hypothetical protein
MFKAYLNNCPHWFENQAEITQFMIDNPTATILEFGQWWNKSTRTWENKPFYRGNYESLSAI